MSHWIHQRCQLGVWRGFHPLGVYLHRPHLRLCPHPATRPRCPSQAATPRTPTTWVWRGCAGSRWRTLREPFGVRWVVSTYAITLLLKRFCLLFVKKKSNILNTVNNNPTCESSHFGCEFSHSSYISPPTFGKKKILICFVVSLMGQSGVKRKILFLKLELILGLISSY